MHWNEFQTTADRLVQGTTEGDWRSAISRSYYALFHYFREFLLGHRLNLGQSGQSHFNLYSGLLHCGLIPVEALAPRIDDLRTSRVWADYDIGRTITAAIAQRCVQEGRAIIASFQALLTTLSPVQVADGVRRHLQAVGRLGKTP
jgi:hypothetical protein